MIVSYKTLNQYVDLSEITPQELGDKLTNAGLEVEEVRPFAQGTNLVMGYVLEAKKHPESDKLKVCIVDIGEENPTQIVCGAPNVDKDMFVVVAKVGSKLKYAKVPEIKKVKLAGVESNGMICSLSELGIAEKFQSQEDLEGIYIALGEYQVGEDALPAIGFDDYVLDISLTPNRSDIYSIYALALEVAALIKKPAYPVKMKIEENRPSKYKVVIESNDCESYCLYDFNDVDSKESSYEVKNQLMALGFKPRFNIVDAGNIAMVVSGNPVHTFDADKLKSDTFIIKKGMEKDDFLALDDKVYQITKDDLLITNGGEIVAIAGIIGSKSSCIDENTKNVVVESAFFDHVTVRKTARRLDLFSEASIRFSKIPNKYTLDFPICLLEELLNIKCEGVVKENQKEYIPKKIVVPHQKIEKVLGLEIDLAICKTILEDLTFKVEVEKGVITCYPPSYRKDVELDVDVIEEIIRVYGYDLIPTKLPLQEIVYQELSPIQDMVSATKDIFVNRGLSEIVTYQLNGRGMLDQFSCNKEYFKLSNPLSEDRACFRDQLYSNMIETISYNMNHQNYDLSLFEVSNVFVEGKEQRILSLGLSGIFEDNLWQKKINKVDFYLIKGLIYAWLEKLGYHYGRFLIEPVERDHAFLHPTRAAYITINKEIIGAFGQIHPELMKKFKIKETYLANINLSKLIQHRPRNNKYEGLNLLPGVTRDLSLVVPNDVNANEIIRIAKTGNNKLVKEVKIFDLYQGENLPEDHYSVSISLKIKDEKQTLTDEKINNVVDTILKNLDNKLNITLRV